MNYYGNVRASLLQGYTASGTGQLNIPVDLLGFDSVTLVISLGTNVNNSTNQVWNLQVSSDNVAFTTIASPRIQVRTDQVLTIEFVKPYERYFRLQMTRTNSQQEVNSVVALRYNYRLDNQLPDPPPDGADIWVNAAGEVRTRESAIVSPQAEPDPDPDP